MSLHPAWQSDDDAQTVPVRVNVTDPDTRVSRIPAALTGVVTTIALIGGGFVGYTQWLGQVTPVEPDVFIHLTPEGAEPREVTVAPGMTIQWVNDDIIPHVLTSETLMLENNQAFDSGILSQTMTYDLTIPATTPEGDYNYISRTSLMINGTITVDPDVTAPITSQGSASSVVSAAAPVISSAATSSAPSIVIPTVSSNSSATSVVVPAPQGSSIPVNTHTVGNRMSSSARSTLTRPRPLTTPESGAPLTVAIIATLCVFGAVAKRALRA